VNKRKPTNLDICKRVKVLLKTPSDDTDYQPCVCPSIYFIEEHFSYQKTEVHRKETLGKRIILNMNSSQYNLISSSQ